MPCRSLRSTKSSFALPSSSPGSGVSGQPWGVGVGVSVGPDVAVGVLRVGVAVAGAVTTNVIAALVASPLVGSVPVSVRACVPIGALDCAVNRTVNDVVEFIGIVNG